MGHDCRPTDEAGKRSMEVAKEYLDRNTRLPEGCRIEGSYVCGSLSHGLAVEGSDEDFQVVYTVPLPSVYSIAEYCESLQTHNPYDLVAYEIGYYFTLLFKGNPKVIEHFFASQGQSGTEWWHRTTSRDGARAEQLLNRTTLSQYCSYAKNRVLAAREFLEAGDVRKARKAAAAALRLRAEASRISRGVPPEVHLTGPLREKLLAVRAGDVEMDLSEGNEEREGENLPAAASPTPFQDALQELRDMQAAELLQSLPQERLKRVQELRGCGGVLLRRGDTGVEVHADPTADIHRELRPQHRGEGGDVRGALLAAFCRGDLTLLHAFFARPVPDDTHPAFRSLLDSCTTSFFSWQNLVALRGQLDGATAPLPARRWACALLKRLLQDPQDLLQALDEVGDGGVEAGEDVQGSLPPAKDLKLLFSTVFPPRPKAPDLFDEWLVNLRLALL